MILCITPNPAIDRTIILPELVPGNVHRAGKVIVAAGGKGLNVARAIRILGGDPLCMGFVGGYTGHLLVDLAQTEGLRSSWTQVNTDTRTCMILVPADGDATVINEPGGPVTSSDWMHLQKDAQQSVSSANVVCISGSLPPNSSAEHLRAFLSMLVDTGKQVWVDTSGTALGTVLAHANVCVKVNGNEIGGALGFEVKELDSAQRALIHLSERGLSASVITLGSAGAVLATKEGKWHAQGPRVHVTSTVGSGDAFLGGLVSALDAGKPWPEALRDGVAAGTANVLLPRGGQFRLQEFKDIREQVQIEAW